MASPQQVEAAERVYSMLTDAGFEVLLDDRDERPGVKFMDADLIGLPIRLTIGDKSLKDGKVELKARVQDKADLVPIDEIVGAVRTLADSLN
jgi:prolyl-tRNA synthetase